MTTCKKVFWGPLAIWPTIVVCVHCARLSTPFEWCSRWGIQRNKHFLLYKLILHNSTALKQLNTTSHRQFYSWVSWTCIYGHFKTLCCSYNFHLRWRWKWMLTPSGTISTSKRNAWIPNRHLHKKKWFPYLQCNIEAAMVLKFHLSYPLLILIS